MTATRTGYGGGELEAFMVVRGDLRRTSQYDPPSLGRTTNPFDLSTDSNHTNNPIKAIRVLIVIILFLGLCMDEGVYYIGANKGWVAVGRGVRMIDIIRASLSRSRKIVTT